MKLRDYSRFILFHLRRQPGRTALTLTGVAVGAAALVFTLSLGLGLRELIDREFQSRAIFWEIAVSPKSAGTGEETIPPEALPLPDDLTGERRARLREHLLDAYRRNHRAFAPKPLTRDVLRLFKEKPDVIDVFASHNETASVRFGARMHRASIVSRRIDTLGLNDRLVGGRLPTSETVYEAVVSESLLWELGVRNDGDFAAVLGKPLTVKLGGSKTNDLAAALGLVGNRLSVDQERLLAKLTTQLPKALDQMDLEPLERAVLKRMFAEQEHHVAEAKAEEAKGRFGAQPKDVAADFAVVGIVRDFTPVERRAREGRFDQVATYSDVYLPEDSGQALFERFPWLKEEGFAVAAVKVRPGGDLKAVVASIEAEGFRTHSAIEWYESVKMEVTLIAGGLNLFAVVSLVVAGIGITNTLATSIVERTREIGILKAVGATRGQILALFLLEGTMIGLAGGLLGVAVARLLIWPGDSLVAELVREQSKGELKATSIFVFPLWLPLAALAFTLVATTLAAWLPARRAARMLPVEALRAP